MQAKKRMPGSRPDIYCSPSAKLNREEKEVAMRIARQIEQARDLWPFIEKVQIVFMGGKTGYTIVHFNQNLWPQEKSEDCGKAISPIHLSKINFDAEKWRSFFSMNMESALDVKIREVMRLLSNATFIEAEISRQLVQKVMQSVSAHARDKEGNSLLQKPAD